MTRTNLQKKLLSTEKKALIRFSKATSNNNEMKLLNLVGS